MTTTVPCAAVPKQSNYNLVRPPNDLKPNKVSLSIPLLSQTEPEPIHSGPALAL